MNTQIEHYPDKKSTSHPDWSGKAAEPIVPGTVRAMTEDRLDNFGGKYYPLAIMDVLTERGKQDRKWGMQFHDPVRWFAILGEEVGEVAHALCENDTEEYRRELIQVAAVAIAAVEEFDRRRANLADQQVHY